jgi:hypothetical protein
MKPSTKFSTGLLLTLFAMLALWQVYLVRETVMGDAFIHFVFARGIAEGTPYFYNGVFSAGSTSPLWSALLAPLWLLLGDGIIWGVKIFAAFFVALAVYLAYPVAYRLTSSRAASLAVVFLLATNFLLSWWAAKGMETPLFVCLVLGSFLAYWRMLESPQSHWRWEALLGVLLGLSIFTRPEGWILAALLGLPLLWQRGARVLLTVALPGLLIPLPYYAWLYLHTGQVFPSSIARVLHAQQFAIESWGIVWTPEIAKILLTKYLPVTPFAVLLLWRQARQELLWQPVFLPVFLWLVFHLVFFTLVMPTSQGERYLLPLVPLWLGLGMAGLWQLRSREFFSTLVLLVLGVSVAISFQQLTEQQQRIALCEVPHIDAVRRETGYWLRDHTPSDSLIAIKEVDQSAYYSGRAVLSIDGTLDTRAVPYVAAADGLGYLREYRPDYLVLEQDMYDLYPDWQANNLTPLLDPTLALGARKSLDGITFTLQQRLPLGTPEACPHFARPYDWYIYAVTYE